MTTYILQRGAKFLQDNYRWGLMPHSFPEWQFEQVLSEAMQYKDRPQRVGELRGNVIEDAVWMEL